MVGDDEQWNITLGSQGGRPRQVWRWGQRYVCDFPPAITQLNVFDLLGTGTFWITHLVLAGNVWQELIQGSLITPPKTCGCIRPVHEPFESASQMSPVLLTSHPTWLWSVGSSALVLLVYCHKSSDPSPFANMPTLNSSRSTFWAQALPTRTVRLHLFASLHHSSSLSTPSPKSNLRRESSLRCSWLSGGREQLRTVASWSDRRSTKFLSAQLLPSSLSNQPHRQVLNQHALRLCIRNLFRSTYAESTVVVDVRHH